MCCFSLPKLARSGFSDLGMRLPLKGVKIPKIGKRGFRSQKNPISHHPRNGRSESKKSHFYTGHYKENGDFWLRTPFFGVVGNGGFFDSETLGKTTQRARLKFSSENVFINPSPSLTAAKQGPGLRNFPSENMKFSNREWNYHTREWLIRAWGNGSFMRSIENEIFQSLGPLGMVLDSEYGPNPDPSVPKTLRDRELLRHSDLTTPLIFTMPQSLLWEETCL